MYSSFKCLAIIVTYNPETQLLYKLINVISLQVNQILLVDNASNSDPLENLSDELKKQIEYIQFDDNLGLGIAHNRGIDYAEKHNFSHVLIMDQDSVPAEDMVKKLYQAEQQLINKGIQLAAVGPNFVSLHDDDETTYIQEVEGQYSSIACQTNEFIETVHLISSGSLIRLSVIQTIGKMDEQLFIDSIDIDWGLLAKSKGYLCYAICNAIMHHQLGDNKIFVKLWNKHIVTHSPLRYYYQFRNAIILYQRSYVTWDWINYHFPRHILIRFFIILFFIPSRFKNISTILFGLWHGIWNKSGKLKK
jgi:rhamnosyltransferase